MKEFQVYKHPIIGIETIKVGFSFPAFFFGWIWMFIKKLWGYGFLFLLLQFLFVIFSELATIAIKEGKFGMFFFTFIFGTSMLIIAGFNGNKWWQEDLLKHGFKSDYVVKASNKDAALALYAEKIKDN